VTDHDFIDYENMERWLQNHNGVLLSLFLLLFAIFGFALHEMFAHSEVFVNDIPFMSTDW